METMQPSIFKILLLALTAIMMSQASDIVCDDGPCLAGQWFEPGTSQCYPCPDGSTIDQNWHKCEECAFCTIPKAYQHEVSLVPCTPSSDTTVGCLPGYFRVRLSAHEFDCWMCSQCEPGQVMLTPCGPDADTVCSDANDGYKAKPKVNCENGPCRTGQWYDFATVQCQLCKPGTFVDQDGHKCMDCKPCSRPDFFNHEILLKNCTATSDAELGCKEGYYRARHYLGHEDECNICSVCKPDEIKVKECGAYTDTVCTEVRKNGGEGWRKGKGGHGT